MEPMRIEQVEARRIAAARGAFTRETLPSIFIALLDKVWATIREQPAVQHGHNVALYDGTSALTAGVEVDATFEPRGDVVLAATPAGRVATTTHVGPVADIGRTYAALDAWCRESGVTRTGVSWEVYGDWEEDESLFRTDLYYLLA
jgi:effector-binding domain-containing protein